MGFEPVQPEALLSIRQPLDSIATYVPFSEGMRHLLLEICIAITSLVFTENYVNFDHDATDVGNALLHEC